MLFSSVTFLFYFLPLILVLYYIFRFNTKIKNFILLVFSLFFYAWGEPKFILIMITSIISNYIFALFVDKFRDNKKVVKWILIATCAVNLGILYVFKYLAFTVGLLNSIAGTNIIVPTILLPIGISFFTFQALSYVIDVYRNTGKVQKNIFDLALYISFFPQLVAGPIVRYQTVADQIDNRKETIDKFSIGCSRFITGLGKKILISNSMAAVADKIYYINDMSEITMSLAWVGAIAYTLQIFYDFSGYSDMAIGLGLMFGFKFDENFNYPYISKSITEFWRRWHISLSTWFKEYVYIPLGGSRVKNKDIMVRNLFVVWLCTGIWHGASLTFIVWGLFNFVLILIEKIIDFEKLKISKIVKHIYALIMINISWVLFRAVDLDAAKRFFTGMLTPVNGFYSDYTIMFIREYAVIFIIAIVFTTPIAKKINFNIQKERVGYNIYHTMYPIIIMSVFIICVTYLVVGTYNPFIYFNF